MPRKKKSLRVQESAGSGSHELPARRAISAPMLLQEVNCVKAHGSGNVIEGCCLPSPATRRTLLKRTSHFLLHQLHFQRLFLLFFLRSTLSPFLILFAMWCLHAERISVTLILLSTISLSILLPDYSVLVTHVPVIANIERSDFNSILWADCC